MDNGRVPDHRWRALFTKGPQALLQLRGARARLPCAVAAQGNEVPHLPTVAEERLDPPANPRRQRAEDGHGELGDSLLKSRKMPAGAFSFGTARDVENPGGLEFLGEAIAAAVGRQYEDVE